MGGLGIPDWSPSLGKKFTAMSSYLFIYLMNAFGVNQEALFGASDVLWCHLSVPVRHEH